MPQAERYKEPLFTSSYFVRPHSRNIAPTFRSAVLSSLPPIQRMVPGTFLYPQYLRRKDPTGQIILDSSEPVPFSLLPMY